MKLLFLILELSIIKTFVEAQSIYVYSDSNGQGQKVEVNISQCSNLPDGMADQLTSTDTRGNCAAFYDSWNCTGSFIEVLPRSPAHHNFHFWGFNDVTKSVGKCRDPCAKEITGHELFENPVPDEITIFSRADFKGAYTTVLVQGCTLVPPRLVHSLLSVKLGSAQCIQFYNNIKCKHKGSGVDTIELRKGTPSHHAISDWYFREARAVSHCSYKCNNDQDLEGNLEGKQIIPENDEVVLYDAKNFEGNWHKLKLTKCIDLMDPWEGVAMSIRTFNKSCVALYDRRGCVGDHLNVIDSSSDLSERKFDEIVRSMKPCRQKLGDKTADPAKNKTTKETGITNRLEESSTLSPAVIAILVVFPLFGVIVSVLLVIFIMRRCHPYKRIMDMLSEKELQEFLYGLGMELNEQSEYPGNGDYSAELLAQNKPYNNAYDVPRSNIKYDEKMPLGSGEFGVVYRGTLTVIGDAPQYANSKPSNSIDAKAFKNITVAVKTIRSDASIQCLRTLLKEVKIMLYVGKHENVVQLVGCCTENLRSKGEIFVLVEYCLNGSLEGFLQKNRDKFNNYVVKGRIDPKLFRKWNLREEKDALEYMNCTSVSNFDLQKLLQWCHEIAKGMEFLSSKKVIHSDLAARNILLDDNLHAKISDFGLSKQLYCYTQYVKKKQEPLPWRWLALESLKNLEFSTMSDVWSFGILSWEVFTLGEKPYPGVVWSNDFIRNIEEGLRLRKPKYALTECYNLMVRCWEENPKLRPSFTEIREDIEEIIQSVNAQATPCQDLLTNTNTLNNLVYL